MLSKVSVFNGDIDCPKCHHVAKILSYIDDIGKEELQCPVCGYRRIDENGEVKEIDGYGAVHIETYNEPFLYEVFDKPLEENRKRKFLKMIYDFFCINEKSYLYVFDPKTEDLEIVYGKVPPTFEDYIKENSLNEWWKFV